MKKSYKTLFALAALTATIVGCSKDDDLSSGVGSYSSDEIGLIASTTRASINTIDALKDNGFKVYGTSGENATTFLISNQMYEYNSTSSEWGWDGTAPTWPTSESSYPMTFYAYYPTNLTFYKLAPTDATSITTTVTVPSSGSQADLLAVMATTDAQPTGGKLSIDFQHILSRVNLDVAAGDDAIVHLQSVDFCGLMPTNTFDFKTMTWKVNPTAANSANYDYLDTANDAIQITKNGESDGSDKYVSDFTPTYSDLMLMPHTLTSWVPSKTVENARVEMIFRATDLASPFADQVGLTRADSHPNFSSGASVDADEHLFIKIALPVTEGTTNSWNAGKQYTYTVNLGGSDTNNGYLADDYYYDESGNKTDLPVKFIEIGDEVSAGDICFEVTVSDWGTPINSSDLN